jgi:hypothetical protein
VRQLSRFNLRKAGTVTQFSLNDADQIVEKAVLRAQDWTG